MNLRELFPSSLSGWVHYGNYEIKSVPGGRRIVPVVHTKPTAFNPLENAVDILLDALNLGKSMGKSIENAENNLLLFARKYGLLGVFSDILLNETFYHYPTSKAFVGRNCFLKEGAYSQEDYLQQFFPAEFRLDTQQENPIFTAVTSKDYGEYTHWFATYMEETYRYFCACAGYADPELNQSYMEIVNRDAPKRLHYAVTAEARPTMQWMFPSLKSVVDIAFAQCVTMEAIPLKTCKHCGKIYYNENARSEFCSGRCRNQWNVYKSRRK